MGRLHLIYTSFGPGPFPVYFHAQLRQLLLKTGPELVLKSVQSLLSQEESQMWQVGRTINYTFFSLS